MNLRDLMDFWAQQEIEKERRVLGVCFLGLSLVDLLTTLYLFFRGNMVEANPLYSYLLSKDVALFILVKLTLTVVAFVVLTAFHDAHRWILRVLVPYMAGLITWQTIALLTLS